MSRIDPTARVAPGAVIADGVEIGAYATIESNVTIGPGTKVGPYCMIQGPTTIGAGCDITGYASIGTPPQDHSYKGEDTRLVIGDHNTIREFVTINRGTAKDKGVTTIGDHNLIMAYCHVAHDCVVGNHVVMGNLATLAGHVEIHDYAIVGGLSAVHQFTRIRRRCIISGGSMVSLGIPMPASGDQGKTLRCNHRAQAGRLQPGAVKAVEKAYRILFKRSSCQRRHRSSRAGIRRRRDHQPHREVS